MKLATGVLTRDQVVDEIRFFEELALIAHEPQLRTMLGWACKLPIDDLWKDVKVEASQLRGWIDDKIKSGIYDPGASDFHLSFSNGSEILFCHESDVHVESDDRALLLAVAKRWLEKRYAVQCAYFGSKWQPFTSVSQLI